MDYIDLLKGITILWIIWIHTYHPDFGGYRNPIFFFASGIFFKLDNFKSFFIKRTKTIIIPFFSFYLISLPFHILVHLWDFHSLNEFDWYMVFDIFKIDKFNYLRLNAPLWFLLSLFWIQTMSTVLFHLPKIIIVVLSLTAICFKNQLLDWPSMFMFNNALYWFSFFGIGFVIGKPLIRLLTTRKAQIWCFICFLSLILLCVGFETSGVYGYSGLLIEHIKYLSFILTFIAFLSFFNKIKSIQILKFFGKNSLIVLGTHMWFILPFERLNLKLTGMHHQWIGLGIATATAIALIPVINILNRKVPYLVGKQNHSPQTTRPSLCRES